MVQSDKAVLAWHQSKDDFWLGNPQLHQPLDVHGVVVAGPVVVVRHDVDSIHELASLGYDRLPGLHWVGQGRDGEGDVEVLAALLPQGLDQVHLEASTGSSWLDIQVNPGDKWVFIAVVSCQNVAYFAKFYPFPPYIGLNLFFLT